MGARTNGPRMDVASKGPGEGTHIAVAGTGLVDRAIHRVLSSQVQSGILTSVGQKKPI